MHIGAKGEDKGAVIGAGEEDEGKVRDEDGREGVGDKDEGEGVAADRKGIGRKMKRQSLYIGLGPLVLG